MRQGATSHRAKAAGWFRRRALAQSILIPMAAIATTAEAAERPRDAIVVAQAPAAVRVGTVLVKEEPVTQAADFVGRIQAIERVAVRARVTGFIEDVLFKEGETVKAGAPLYRIEREPFAAAVERAEGSLLKAEGQAANATAQRVRAEELLKTNAGSAAVRDTRVGEEKTALGDVATAKADLATAKINLGYTEITAPITGLIGRTAVTKGNVVGPDTGTLATIVSQNPMYVVVPVSQREFLTIRRDEHSMLRDAINVRIKFSDGTAYDQTGKLNFVDTQVDQATDTVTVRAVLPNPNGMLIDGQYVRVSLAAKEPEQKLVVPQAALIADQRGLYVFVVEDGKAVVRRVEVAGNAGINAVVASGLKKGEQVIVEGIEGLRPGAPVTPAPAQLIGDRS